jgi:hypothetical protein
MTFSSLSRDWGGRMYTELAYGSQDTDPIVKGV